MKYRRVLYSRNNINFHYRNPKNHSIDLNIYFLTLYVLLAVFQPSAIVLHFISRLSSYIISISRCIYISLYISPSFWRDLYWYTSPSNLHPFTATHPSTIFILQFTTVSWSLRVFVSSGMSFFFYYSWNMGNKFLTQKIFDWNGKLWRYHIHKKENGSWIN